VLRPCRALRRSFECYRSVVLVSSKCDPRVGQVLKLCCNDDEIVKPTSLVALEESSSVLIVAWRRTVYLVFACLPVS